MTAGQNHFGSGDMAGAEREFQKAVKAAPAIMEGWFNLATVVLRRGRAADAVRLLRQAESIGPSSALIQRALIDACDASGEAAQAMAACVRSIALQPSADGWNRLGVLRRAFWEFEQAEFAYTQALRLEPGHAYARVNLGTLLVLLGRYREARPLLSAVLADSDNPAATTEARQALQLLDERDRLDVPMQAAFTGRRFDRASALLERTPDEFLGQDPQVSPFLAQLCEGGAGIADRPATNWALPEDWPDIEAHFSQHGDASVAAYLSALAHRAQAPDTSRAAEWSLHADAIRQRRSDTGQRLWPAHPELALRYAHWSILKGVDDTRYCPGLFKLQPNYVRTNAAEPRTHPMQVVGTIRQFFGSLLPRVPAVDARAMITYLMILKSHCFIDGNGRAARYMLNLILEAGGRSPVIFPDSMAKEWILVQRGIYRSADITPFLAQLDRARAFTRDFLSELATARSQTDIRQRQHSDCEG